MRRYSFWGLAMMCLLLGSGAAPAAEPALRWKEDPGKVLALERGDKELWALHFDAREGKPYFHPLRTVSGHDLTWFRPDDHPWHLGLWFSWKLINGLNYWETDAKAGLCEGTTELTDVKISKHDDFSATVICQISYHPPQKPAVLTETRTLTIRPPQADGTYSIDWHAAFSAGDQPVTLDRTKPPSQGGPAWGGYAGLSLRSAKTQTQRVTLDSTGWQNSAKLMGWGKPADWMDLSGLVDEPTKTAAGLTIFDHPSSLRHPTPWYINMDGTFGCIIPAPLFAEPLKLKPQEQFTLFYRLLVHDGPADAARLNAEFAQFAKSGH